MKILAKNKKAYFDYEILDEYEAGLSLKGHEVKSIKGGLCNLKGCYVTCLNEEAFMNEAHISKYKHSNDPDHDPKRQIKLLLHKKELSKIEGQLSQQGVTAVTLEIYLKNNKIKAKIGICKGKKKHDKRRDLKKKAQDREVQIAMKKYT